jgi:UDP-2-acetamido-3-amino-2,3-dideoxy-glucuronate N-acetyltransferase
VRWKVNTVKRLLYKKMERNIALIGAGNWGKNHLRNLSELGVLHSVLDIDDQILRQLENDYPDLCFLKDENKILNNSSIKAVIVATPVELHYKLAKNYLSNGKDVLVEKPLALNSAEGEELVEIADKKKRILMVGHVLQYHTAVIKLKEIIDTGDLGEIRYLHSNRLNLGKLRIEESVLWSFAPHDISVILMLMEGQVPVKVNAFGGSYITEGIYDTTVTELEFKNNVKSHIYVSWLHPYKEQKMIVIGSKKMAVFDDVSSEKLFIYPYKVNYKNGIIPVAQIAEYRAVDFEQKEPLNEELLHFLDCIQKRKTPKTDGVEGLKVLRVLEKAQKSLMKN